MKRLDRTLKSVFLCILALFFAGVAAAATMIQGTVAEATGNRVKISYQGDLAPNHGDQVEIWYELAGDRLSLEGSWKVVEISEKFIFAEEDGSVPVKPSYGYLASISSANPVPRPRETANTSTGRGKGKASASYDEGYRLYTEKRYDEALPILENLAGQGHAAAQSVLGGMYEKGNGVAKDYAKAVELFRRSADQGDRVGQRRLARMYDKGQGVSKDHTQAFTWFLKAAEQDDAYSQNSVGWYYQQGWGVERDYAEAVRWYRQSTENMNTFAPNNLGYLYFMGLGVKKNYSEALRYFERGAKNGNVNSNILIGLMYKYGLGTGVDEQQAEYHLSLVNDLEKEMRDIASHDFFPAQWWLEERGVK